MASPCLLAKIHRIITFYIIAHVYYQNKEQQQYQSYVDFIQCYTFENISGYNHYNMKVIFINIFQVCTW